MTKKLLLVATILLVVTFVAFAADVSGKWTYQQPGRGGGDPIPVTITLKADGAKLTGSQTRPGFNGGDPRTTEISDGKVDGNKIAFNIKMSFGDQEFVQKYEGTLAGDELKLKLTMPGRDGGDPTTREFSAKKAQ
jgi:hypothetical protein